MSPAEFSPSASQRAQFEELERLALHFNERINLYSAASTEQFVDRHIRHSLALATRRFPAGSVIVDWGTGGGMPGLVLAIVFPACDFHLVDAVEKKIRAVRTIARRLGLSNVEAHHTRAESFRADATHSVSRATAPLATLWDWHQRTVLPTPLSEESDVWPQGLICLKGGELDDEIAALRRADPTVQVREEPLPTSLEDAGLEEKVIVTVTKA